MSLLAEGNWFGVRDGDPRAFALYRRHYSYTPRPSTQIGAPNGQRIIGPCERMVLMTQTCDALFAWIFPKVERRDHQHGVNCSVFWNESTALSSDLIREACELAWARWPNQRLWTYVNPRAIRSSNPGACFKKAGFAVCGRSQKGLVILERWPAPTRCILSDVGYDDYEVQDVTA